MTDSRIGRALQCAISLVMFCATAHAAQTTTVRIKNFHFAAPEVTIHTGETVVWQNDDEEPHTVTSDTGLFRSGAIDGGQSFRFAFQKPGVYKYICSIHPQMMGTIVVK